MKMNIIFIFTYPARLFDFSQAKFQWATAPFEDEAQVSRFRNFVRSENQPADPQRSRVTERGWPPPRGRWKSWCGSTTSKLRKPNLRLTNQKGRTAPSGEARGGHDPAKSDAAVLPRVVFPPISV